MGKKSREKRQRREQGTRTIKINSEARAALEEQRTRFREKFGRDPGPEDPVFFDPDKDTPQPLSPEAMDEIGRMVAQVMGEVGIDPAIIYAIQRTGRIAPPSEEAYEAMSPEDKAEWVAALDEYDAMAEKAKDQKQ